MHSAGALHVTHPHSQVGYRWEAPKVSSPQDSQELRPRARPVPAPALPQPCPGPAPPAPPLPAVPPPSGRIREAGRSPDAMAGPGGPSGRAPATLTPRAPARPAHRCYKGKAGWALAKSFVRRLGSYSVYSSVRSLVRPQQPRW